MQIVKYSEIFIVKESKLSDTIGFAWKKIKSITNKNSITTLDYINSLKTNKEKDEAFKDRALRYEISKGVIRLQELIEEDNYKDMLHLIDKIILSLAQTKTYANANTLLQQLKAIREYAKKNVK